MKRPPDLTSHSIVFIGSQPRRLIHDKTPRPPTVNVTRRKGTLLIGAEVARAIGTSQSGAFDSFRCACSAGRAEFRNSTAPPPLSRTLCDALSMRAHTQTCAHKHTRYLHCLVFILTSTRRSYQQTIPPHLLRIFKSLIVCCPMLSRTISNLYCCLLSEFRSKGYSRLTFTQYVIAACTKIVLIGSDIFLQASARSGHLW